jgi:hypothetical protein
VNLKRFRHYTRWHQFANEKEHDAPADPWRLLSVDPGGVEHCTNRIRLNWGLGRIKNGDWDQEENHDLLTETSTYRGLTQRFEKGYDWEDTAQYQRAKKRFDESSTFRGYSSLEEYRNIRCEYVDKLFRSIKQDGYRPNGEATHEKPTENNPFEDAYANHLEPLVVITRSGEIVWTEGYHRLIIASILNIDEIPVYVLCRHKQWQRIRNQIHETQVSNVPPETKAHLDHPDLQNIVS